MKKFTSLLILMPLLCGCLTTNSEADIPYWHENLPEEEGMIFSSAYYDSSDITSARLGASGIARNAMYEKIGTQALDLLKEYGREQEIDLSGGVEDAVLQTVQIAVLGYSTVVEVYTTNSGRVYVLLGIEKSVLIREVQSAFPELDELVELIIIPIS